MKRFPEGFYWGASTAAYQVEGNIHNCDWAEAERERKVPPCGRACDFYNRYDEDFALARSLGMNAQRFSLEWSRIEPEEGVFDESQIEHYRAVVRSCKKHGMTPFVTLWHFTLPQWFAQRGGFIRRDAPEIFARYCRFAAEKLGDDVPVVITMNEPEVFAAGGYATGFTPPFEISPILYLRALTRLAEAHRVAYTAVKEVRPDAEVGIAKHNIFFTANKNPLNRGLRAAADWFWNHSFLRRTEGFHDFIGLNHYHFRKFGMTRAERDEATPTFFGCYEHPDSLYETLAALKKYNVPVHVLENGVADGTDVRRIDYIRNAAANVHRAIETGVPVKGYFHWTLLDNYEWLFGYGVPMGLVAVDLKTQKRTPRPSAETYAAICRANVLE